MGWVLIVAGIWVIASFFHNYFMLLLGIGMVFWGICLLGKQKPKETEKKTRKRTGGYVPDTGDDYSGSVHTGSGAPDHVYRSDGSYVNLHGDGWRETFDGGRENVYTGEQVERDRVYGTYSYSDGDGDTDDRANFGYDSDDD